jgi:two-component system response regulator QseB
MRILLVEDDAMLGEATAAGLRQDGHALDWVTDAPAARAVLQSVPYDGVLLDLGLPRGDGLEILKWLRGRGLDCVVIVVTARDRLAERIAGLDEGADDYLVKPFDLEELAARLRAVERRRSALRASVVSIGDVVVDLGRRRCSVAGQPVMLTAREFSLLEALVVHAGRPVARRTLEERLYGFGEEIASNAVEVHVHHLRRKLGDKFILTERGHGYRVEA